MYSNTDLKWFGFIFTRRDIGLSLAEIGKIC